MVIKRKSLDYLIGFCITFPLFIEFKGGSFFLYKGSTLDTGTVLPLSIFVLPFAIFLSIHNGKLRLPINRKYKIILFSFVLWLMTLGFFSALINGDIRVFTYMIQWIVPISFMLYTLNILQQEKRLVSFFKGTFHALLFALAWITSSVLLERTSFSLFSHARLHGSFWGIGIYQVFSYVPLAFAFLLLFHFPKYFSKGSMDGNFSKSLAFVAFIFVFLLIFISGARGSFLVLSFGILIYMMFHKRIISARVRYILKILLFGVVFFLMIYAEEFRMIEKYHADIVESNITAERMEVANDYLRVFYESPVFGSGLLKPAIKYPGLAASAHNFYVDTLAWTGPFGFVLILAIVINILIDAYRLYVTGRVRYLRRRNPFYYKTYIGTLIPLLLIFFISNNLRVPMRQTYSAVIIYGFLGILLGLFAFINKLTSASHSSKAQAGPTYGK